MWNFYFFSKEGLRPGIWEAVAYKVILILRFLSFHFSESNVFYLMYLCIFWRWPAILNSLLVVIISQMYERYAGQKLALHMIKYSYI